MKKVLALLLVLALTLGLCACSKEEKKEDTAPTKAVEATSTPTEAVTEAPTEAVTPTEAESEIDEALLNAAEKINNEGSVEPTTEPVDVDVTPVETETVLPAGTVSAAGFSEEAAAVIASIDPEAHKDKFKKGTMKMELVGSMDLSSFVSGTEADANVPTVVPFNVSMTMTTEGDLKAAHCVTHMDMNAMGQSQVQDSDMYFELCDDGSYTLYTSTDGTQYVKTVATYKEIESLQMNAYNFDYFKSLEVVSETDDEIVLSGIVDFSKLSDMLGSSLDSLVGSSSVITGECVMYLYYNKNEKDIMKSSIDMAEIMNTATYGLLVCDTAYIEYEVLGYSDETYEVPESVKSGAVEFSTGYDDSDWSTYDWDDSDYEDLLKGLDNINEEEAVQDLLDTLDD